MAINTILFDLDGTLLPMDQNEFANAYFKEITQACANGYEHKQFVNAIWIGTKAMIENDGGKTNRERFLDAFAACLGEEARMLEPTFDLFYANEFNNVRHVVHPNPIIGEFITLFKSKGYTLVLATNPVFPAVATDSRICWAGLCKDDYALVTTYEKSRHCKPNLDYFKYDVLSHIGKTADECLMVGNDVEADMSACHLGMQAYLITEYMDNPKNEDITQFKRGSYADFFAYVKALPSLK